MNDFCVNCTKLLHEIFILRAFRLFLIVLPSKSKFSVLCACDSFMALKSSVASVVFGETRASFRSGCCRLPASGSPTQCGRGMMG